MASDTQIRNRQLVLNYVSHLLDSYQVRGFGGAPPPAPVVYQLPASSLSASRLFVDPVSYAVPGMSVYQLVQMLAAGVADAQEGTHPFPPPDTSSPVFAAPRASWSPPPIPASEFDERPLGWERALALMQGDVDSM
eukprot:jgi/Mesvir1/12813/Mv05606-RA.1